MDKTSGLNDGVRIPGRGRCSSRTTAVDARVKYQLYLSIYRGFFFILIWYSLFQSIFNIRWSKHMRLKTTLYHVLLDISVFWHIFLRLFYVLQLILEWCVFVLVFPWPQWLLSLQLLLLLVNSLLFVINSILWRKILTKWRLKILIWTLFWPVNVSKSKA